MQGEVVRIERYRAVSRVVFALVPVNLLLFGVKLYVGLSSNSIAIYSDAVNNLFDGLSALVTAAALWSMLRKTDARSPGQLKKTEQLFSFLLSVVVTFTGFYFAYCSLERFMYPTPVWFTGLYLGALVATALVKLGLFFYLRKKTRTVPSPVLSALAADSLLDFFITLMTVATLLLSLTGTFSFDALFGLVISTVIVVSAVKSVLAAAAILVDYVPQKDRDAVGEILSAVPEENLREVRFYRDGTHTECAVYISAVPENAVSLRRETFETCHIHLDFIEKTEESES